MQRTPLPAFPPHPWKLKICWLPVLVTVQPVSPSSAQLHHFLNHTLIHFSLSPSEPSPAPIFHTLHRKPLHLHSYSQDWCKRGQMTIKLLLTSSHQENPEASSILTYLLYFFFKTGSHLSWNFLCRLGWPHPHRDPLSGISHLCHCALPDIFTLAPLQS